MEIIGSVDEMQARCEEIRLSGKIMALVPTAGSFHDGHLELMRVGRQHADTLIASLFVNPALYSPDELDEALPPDTEGDLVKAEGAGVDMVFMPSVEEMYPEGHQTTVHVDIVTRPFYGPSQPSHCDGAATEVIKLFHIVKPHLAVFGQKNYQLLTVISRMVRDLDMDIQIVGVRTVREPDGLAVSSRNVDLSEEERASALCLKGSLDMAEGMVREGETDTAKLRAAVEDFIGEHPRTQIDYVLFCHSVTLEEIKTIDDESLLALAVRVGKARLTDNCLLGRPARTL